MQAQAAAASTSEETIAQRDALIRSLRLQLEIAAARVIDAQLERDRAQSHLAKVTQCLVECQAQIVDATALSDECLKQVNELRTLVDSQQEEMRRVTDELQQTRGLCDELKTENARYRAEQQAPVPRPQPVAPRKFKEHLVNVPR